MSCNLLSGWATYLPEVGTHSFLQRLTLSVWLHFFSGKPRDIYMDWTKFDAIDWLPCCIILTGWNEHQNMFEKTIEKTAKTNFNGLTTASINLISVTHDLSRVQHSSEY